MALSLTHREWKTENRGGKMIARKKGGKVENACVSYTSLGDDTYALLLISNREPIGRASKLSPRRFEATVGIHTDTFTTMADVIVWASNLVYEGKL